MITLTGPEMWLAGMTGLARWIEARVKGRKPVNSQDVYTAIGDDIAGAMAEAAVAKYLGVYWLGEWLNHKCPDVGGYQVRHTRYPGGKLLLQPEDKDEEEYILVTGTPPKFSIAGTIFAKQGKQDRYWDTTMKRPCFAVPQHDLQTLDKEAAA